MPDVLNAYIYSYVVQQPYDGISPPAVSSLRQLSKAQLGETVSALAFFAVRTNGNSPSMQILQLWDNGGRLGLLVYTPQSENFTYTYAWGTANLSPSSAALAFLPVDMNGDGSIQIVQLFDSGGRLGMNVFGPQTDGSYASLWSTSDVGQGSGALAFFPVTMNGDGKTQIVQLWDNGGQLGMIVYAPQPDGSYTVLWGIGDVGEGSAAVTFIPVRTTANGKSQIVQVQADSSGLGIVIYAPQANGSYVVWDRTVGYAFGESSTIAFVPVTMKASFGQYTQLVQLLDQGGGNLACVIYSTEPSFPDVGFFNSNPEPLGNGGLPALAFLPTGSPTQIAHFFNAGGSLGYHYYVPAKSSPQAPDNDVYQQTASGTLDAPPSAVAFLSVSMQYFTETQIVQLVVEPAPVPTVATVPDVLQTVSTLAEKAVVAAGLVARFLGDNRQGAWVFSQAPVAGTTVALGSTVTMVLKTGPQP